MQVFPPSPADYSVLLAPLFLFFACQTTVTHAFLLSFFALLARSGISYENYCNLAICTLLGPFLILQNISNASYVIK
jgi:hypothetical protein